MPKPGNRAANRLVMRFVTAKLKAATQRLRSRIRRMGASRITRRETYAAMIIGGENGARDGGHASAPTVGCLLPEGSQYLFICLSKHESYTLQTRLPVQN